MTSDFFGQFSSAGESSFKKLQSLGEINSKTIKKLADINFTLATMGIELSVEQAKLLTDARSYNDLFSAGSGLASEFGSKLMEINSEVSGVLAESTEEFMDWVKDGFEAAGKAGAKPVPTRPAQAKTTAKKTSTKKAA